LGYCEYFPLEIELITPTVLDSCGAGVVGQTKPRVQPLNQHTIARWQSGKIFVRRYFLLIR
jgi:hypothetical protein